MNFFIVCRYISLTCRSLLPALFPLVLICSQGLWVPRIEAQTLRAEDPLIPNDLYDDDVTTERPVDSELKETIEKRDRMHPWQRYIRGFREGHNFALSAGGSRGLWHVNHLGDIENRSFSSSGAFARFQYSFHLPIYAGFGYMLGTAFGYHYESVEDRQIFRPAPSMIFPGVVAGLVYNINPFLRFGVDAEAGLERHNGVRERDDIGQPFEIFITMQSYAAVGFIDLFYRLNWAVRLEAHRRVLRYLKPAAWQGFPVDAHMHKEDRWLGLGVVYHVL